MVLHMKYIEKRIVISKKIHFSYKRPFLHKITLRLHQLAHTKMT